VALGGIEDGQDIKFIKKSLFLNSIGSNGKK